MSLHDILNVKLLKGNAFVKTTETFNETTLGLLNTAMQREPKICFRQQVQI